MTFLPRYALAGALALLAAPAFAQPVATIPTESPQPALVKMLPPAVAKSGTLVLAVAIGSPPDDFRDAQGHVVGWEIDIMRAASQALGLKLELRPTTFDTLIPGLQAHRFDAATGQIGITDVREKVLDMIGTLLANEQFAALPGNPIKVTSLLDLCGLTVATTRGSREMVFAANEAASCKAAGKKPVDALAFNDGTSAAEAMISGRADLFWLGSTAVSYFVAHSGGRAKVVGSYTDTSYLGVALPKGSALAVPLQAAIQHLVDDGTYGRIVAKWGLGSGAVKTVPLNPTGTPR